MDSKSIVQNYYKSFNSKNYTEMMNLLSENIVHEVNQGKERKGKKLFSDFLNHMDVCYDENLSDIVIYHTQDPTKIAAEFIVNGTYKKTDAGLPEAKNQKYALPAAAFFTVKNEKIEKIVTYYNLPKWIELVS